MRLAKAWVKRNMKMPHHGLKQFFFLPTGRVVRADIMTESSGRSKGCGTVLFDAPEDAAHAISIL